jgi:hypothetical protein
MPAIGEIAMDKFEELKNPYTLQFSFIPPKFIERTLITNEIIGNFIREVPTYRGMFITGVRGSGKTVILGEIRNRMREMENWICVDLNPESNLLDSLARALYLIPELKALFLKTKLDFSVLGIGVHMENAELVASNEEDALKMMLNALKKFKKKVLVTIDEVTYSNDVAKFSHALSSYAGEGYDIYVLMTGLKENIKVIKNQKSLTFLYRAGVKELDSLNITAICSDYQKTMNLNREQAEEMAYSTKGYSLAYQALGYHYWNALSRAGKGEQIDMAEVYERLDITLAELAYDKIWDEYSANDKKILIILKELSAENECASVKVEDIRKKADMKSNTFNTYRTRLLDSGVVDSKQYGYLSIKLPRFDRYIETADM